MRLIRVVCLSSAIVASFLAVQSPVAFGQAVTVSPPTLGFGNQVVNTTTAARQVTLKNELSTALTISSISTNLADYAQTSSCPISPATLRAGAGCLIWVTFTPSALGTRPGSLTIIDNASNSPQTVSLIGSGVVAAAATPTTVAFGNQTLGTTSAPSTVTVRNNQTTALTISSITSSLSDFQDTTTCPLAPASLAASSSCTVAISFAPTMTGKRTGTLTVSDSANNSPQTVSLTGMGIASVLVSIAVTPTPASIAQGTSQQFTAIGTYSNGTTQNLTTSVTWASSATSVATIASGGLAVSVGQGTTSITAVSGAISGSATLQVTPPALVSLSVSPASTSIALGASQQFTATGTYSNGTTQNLTSSVLWTSSATSVASVGSGGLAVSVGPGTTNINAVSGTISGSATLQVTPPLLVGLSVSPANVSIGAGTTQQFTATGTYGNGSTQNLTTSVTWTTSAPLVATVSAGGLASSVSQGMTIITASTGTFSSAATLSVGSPILTSIALTPANPSFAAGTTQPLQATGTYSDGSTLNLTNTAVWTSGSPAVATVNGQGVVTGVANGTGSITASVGSIAGSTTATVTAATLVSIAVTPAIPMIPVGSTQAFTATGTYTDGSTQNITDTVQWSSDITAVATVSNQSGSQGLASGVSAGTATIVAAAGTLTGSTVLTVGGVSLVSIAVAPATPSIALGTTQQFTATGTFSDGSTENLTSIAAWSSDTVSTATINNVGLADSVGVGTATISATSGPVTGSTLLTVTPATLVSIAVTPPMPSIAVGTTQQFTATGTFTDSSTQNLTQSGYWTSSAATVATISDSSGTQGLATALGAGITTITVLDGSVTGTTALTVNPITLVSIAINPPTAAIALGTTQQFTATGTYSDGSTQNLTGVVTWSSSLAGVAIIGNSPGSAGLATSAGEGATAITATLGQVSSLAQLTVGQPSLVSIAIAPTNISIAVGATQQFQATGAFTDGSTQNLTASATWASSAPAVVSISAGGLASGLGLGNATISAASGSITNATGVTVTTPVLVSLSVSPATASIPVLSQQQYSATGTYSDGSTQVLTDSVTWTSSSTSTAPIGATGLASGGTAGTATITASSGAISGTGLLSVGIGSVNGAVSVSCGSGFAANSQCTQATISCPNTANLLFNYGVKQGTGAGTIVIYNGAAGTNPGGSNYVASFNAAGFTTVQVAWATDWQATGVSALSILTAACRPASVGQYIYSNFYSTGGFGVLGGSAGAGAVGYWLAWYSGGNILDNAELASGPVYSNIEQGCEVPDAGSVTIVPTDGTPWVDGLSYGGGTQNGITTETGYTCQPTSGTTSSTADAAWLAQSIVQPGWTSSFPETNISGWVCNNAGNNSEAEAWLFFSGLTTPYALTAISECANSETVDGGYTPQGVLGSTAITNDMIAQTYDRHSN